MECNLILAGVGGQGILTIAQAISLAAMHRGWNVKQAEVHGMSQRGGDVQSHLRFSDGPLHSDLVPMGRADLIIAVEPLEALRYVQYLGEEGAIASNTVPFVNIPNYPPVEETLDRIAGFRKHVLINASRLAAAAGSGRASNIAVLGAASVYLPLDLKELEASVAEMFARKGSAMVDVNLAALRLGRQAADVYRQARLSGGAPRAVRMWLESFPPSQLAQVEKPDPRAMGFAGAESELSDAETDAIEQTLQGVVQQGRRRLYEHEVYAVVELVGAIAPPRHFLVEPGQTLTGEQLSRLRSGKVALKVVSPDIVHKTEAGAVRFVANDVDAVTREMDAQHRRCGETGAEVDGILVVEFVEQAASGFGKELFVGIRKTREFGPVIAAGLGGVDTEYLAAKLRPGVAVAKAPAVDISAAAFFELFRKTAAYEILAGRVRGHDRVVSDGELLRCFRAFLALAKRFCVEREAGAPCIEELEVNPFAFVMQQMVPLDGRASLAVPVGGSIETSVLSDESRPKQHRPVNEYPLPKTRQLALPPRPIDKIRSLLEPRAIGVMGVSSTRCNFGRLILNNIQACGFPARDLYVIKEQSEPIDGVCCVPDLSKLPQDLDLLVVSTAAKGLAEQVEQIIRSGRVGSVILIPGGLGEKEGSEDLQEQIRRNIQLARRGEGPGRAEGRRVPVFLGPNCMGVRSRVGRYDTFFIPEAKLDQRRDAPPRRVGLISQSGAFIITRLSNLPTLDPAFAISAGNQVDLTLSDLLLAVGARSDVDCIGVYIEGFNDLDGLAFTRAVTKISGNGKVVICYKAGRTPAGRSATAGHTASVAGDYEVCDAALAQAGAIVVDTFKEFEQLLELATALHSKTVRGRRIAAISNAGYEAVGMADAVRGMRYQLDMVDLSEDSRQHLARVLADHHLDGLVNARNPLDLTPMANDEAYEHCVRTLLGADEVDAVVAACVPVTPEMLTGTDEIRKPGSLAQRLTAIFQESRKPIIAVIDSGRMFDPLVHALQSAGIPVFRSADQAIRSLGRYLCHRSAK